MITKEMIEAAARALYEGRDPRPTRSWDHAHEIYHEEWRQAAEIALTAALSVAETPEEGRMPAYFTCERDTPAGNLYYFAPINASPPPYLTQRHVKAVLDIADDGTLAGVELIDYMPPPPTQEERKGAAGECTCEAGKKPE